MKKYFNFALYFALGFFALFECDSFFGTVSQTVFTVENEYLVYGISCFAAMVGVAIFLVFRRVKKTVRQVLLFFGFMCAAAAPMAAYIFQNALIFWTSLIVFYIAEGLNTAVCAFCLYKIKEKDTNIKTGLLLAVTSSLGLILNYAADFLFESMLIFKTALLSTTILIMMFIAFKRIDMVNTAAEREQIAEDKSRKYKKNYLPILFTVTASIAIISYMIGVNDVAIFTALLSNPNGEFFWPQLLYIPALLIAGLLADVKNGKFLSIAMFGCTLLTAPSVLRLSSPEDFAGYSGMAFFLGGFYLVYSMTGLLSIAGRGKFPALVTSTSAFVFFLFSGVGAFTSSKYFREDGVFSLTVFIGLSVLLLVVFYLSGSLQPISAEQWQPIVPEKKLLENYGFTNREKEVLQLLLDGHSTADIAEKMTVTEKTIYKYISALLSKTGKSSRASMLVMFNTKES